uniref:Uncharacterized protein n=1 Tax=Nucleocytoviricota sp. TaxID=2809609 RepID=A0A9E8G5C4_9VIRU|nr:hypothetical protein [Nucleocytoviricota sp.]
MSGFIGDKNPSKLGGGIPGATNNQVNLCQSGRKLKNLEVQDRFRLRRAFGNSAINNMYNNTSTLYASSQGKAATTPFRAAFNAGDPAGTVNETTNPVYGRAPNQVTSSSLGRLNMLSLGDGPRQGGQAAWSGNVKYVYDSSDYITYRKLRAKNQTYNDKNLAGRNASTVFTVLNRVRS